MVIQPNSPTNTAARQTELPLHSVGPITVAPNSHNKPAATPPEATPQASKLLLRNKRLQTHLLKTLRLLANDIAANEPNLIKPPSWLLKRWVALYCAQLAPVQQSLDIYSFQHLVGFLRKIHYLATSALDRSEHETPLYELTQHANFTLADATLFSSAAILYLRTIRN